MRHLLELHRAEIAQQDRDLATYVVLRIMESLVHAMALEPPAGFDAKQLEQAVVDAVMGYLATPGGAAPRKTVKAVKAVKAAAKPAGVVATAAAKKTPRRKSGA